MSRKKKINRNATLGPMTPFTRHPVPPEAEREGVIATFENNRYVVFIKKQLSPAYMDDQGKPIEMAHMIVSRKDGKAVRSWSDLHRIKVELLGNATEAVELFPAAWREMSTIRDSQAHLWALPPGATFPFGLVPEGIDSVSETQQSELDDLMLSKEDIEVFVVRSGQGEAAVVEVFANKDEATEMYEKQGAKVPESAIVMRIGDVPAESEHVGWTEAAKRKMAHVISKAEEATKRMRESIGQAEGDLMEQIDVAPGSIEEEMEAEEGGYENPKTLEDHLLLASAMQSRMGQRQEERQARLKEVGEIVEGASLEAEEACEQAAVDLAKMRERFVKSGDIRGDDEEKGGGGETEE